MKNRAEEIKYLSKTNRNLLLPLKVKICLKALIVTLISYFIPFLLLYFVGKPILPQENCSETLHVYGRNAAMGERSRAH